MISVCLSAEKKQNGTAEVGLFSVKNILSVKGCDKAMHLALDGKCGFVYTLRPKGKIRSAALASFYHFVADHP